jgi:hypothetical protein
MRAEELPMSDNLSEYARKANDELRKEILVNLPPERKLGGLPVKELLKGLTLEERLKGITVADLLRELPREMLEAIIRLHESRASATKPS